MTWWAWLLTWLATQPLIAIGWHLFVRWQRGGTR